MLGIIIGIASVVSIVVVGDAAKQMVLADIRSIGTNIIDVYPGKDFGDDDPQYQQALKYGRFQPGNKGGKHVTPFPKRKKEVA